MKKKPSRTSDRKPRPVQPIALQQVQGRAGAELNLDGIDDPLENRGRQHNETLVRDSAHSRSRRAACQESR